MKKNKIYSHPILAPLSQNDKEDIWHAFRAKYPDWKWFFSFSGLWILWSFTFLILAQFLAESTNGLIAKILVHFIFFICIGVIGGTILIGYFMLPRRKKDFHAYLEDKTLEQIKKDLGSHISSERPIYR
jgi:hypothetical protein